MSSSGMCSYIPNPVLVSISASEASDKDDTEDKIDAVFGGKCLVTDDCFYQRGRN